MPKQPTSILFDFVLEKAADETAARRVRLYRALASVIGNESDAVTLVTLADDLEAIERKHRQLVLDFKRRAL
jgi:hypothetical protein